MSTPTIVPLVIRSQPSEKTAGKVGRPKKVKQSMTTTSVIEDNLSNADDNRSAPKLKLLFGSSFIQMPKGCSVTLLMCHYIQLLEHTPSINMSSNVEAKKSLAGRKRRISQLNESSSTSIVRPRGRPKNSTKSKQHSSLPTVSMITSQSVDKSTRGKYM
jgi:hypothetical protein